jgi:hypothetical protein
MRTRILLFSGIVLAFCVWFLLNPNIRTTNSPLEHQPTFTDQQLSHPKSVENRTLSNALKASSVRVSSLGPAAIHGQSNSVDPRLLEVWQAPIEFYGRVVDENNNAVPDANIHFGWSEQPTDSGMETAETTSDSEGLFSLHGKHGASLTVSFGKEGYYSSHKGQMSFNYALGPDIISPDAQEPIIFLLRKKGQAEPLIHIGGIGLHTMRDYVLTSDGKPTDVSLMTGNRMPAGQGDLEVAFQAGLPLDRFPSRITWQCEVSVPGGGLVPTSEEFPFLAPDDGYQAFDERNITVTNWTEDVNQQYYVKLMNGDYGRVNLRIIGTTRPYFRMESYLNPSGSRNLEPMEVQPPRRELPPGVREVIPEFK